MLATRSGRGFTEQTLERPARADSSRRRHIFFLGLLERRKSAAGQILVHRGPQQRDQGRGRSGNPDHVRPQAQLPRQVRQIPHRVERPQF